MMQAFRRSAGTSENLHHLCPDLFLVIIFLGNLCLSLNFYGNTSSQERAYFGY